MAAGSERMYLEKGEKVIHVDASLPQHQLDGIRFLYRMFKKRKSGVILNDPPGYGKRVQTVLFLEAVQPLLTRPILILCSDGKEQIWIRHFFKWTNMGSEVSIYKSNLLINPRCVVSATSSVGRLPRREWSVLVVDDGAVTRDLLRARLAADYKIWLISVDMKKNLQTFSLINKWLHPEDSYDFNVEDYQVTKKTPTNVLIKSARLDAFMEDMVIRRKDVTLPLGKSHEAVNAEKVTRKNKDPTGKKIKRSKPIPKDETETNSQSISFEPLNTEFNMAPKLPKVWEFERKRDNIEYHTVKDKVPTKMNVDISDKELNGANNNSNHRMKIDTESDKSDIIKDKDESKVKYGKMDIESKSKHDRVASSDKAEEFGVLDESYKVLSTNTINSQNIIIRYDSDTPDSDEDMTNDDNRITVTKKANEINSKSNQNQSEDVFSTDASNDTKNDITVNKNDINNLATKNNKSYFDINEIHSVEQDTPSDIPLNEFKDEVLEIKTDDINRNKNELANKNNVSENNKTGPKLGGVELKVKQLEELAMNKFKGSILDNMF